MGGEQRKPGSNIGKTDNAEEKSSEERNVREVISTILYLAILCGGIFYPSLCRSENSCAWGFYGYNFI